MEGYEEVLRALGRIEGELVEIRKLSAADEDLLQQTKICSSD